MLNETKIKTSLKPGMFIAFEGADGSGKSTQAKQLAEWINQNTEHTAHYTREPGGTKYAEALRNVLVTYNDPQETPDKTANLLGYLACRIQHLKKCIIPRLRKGEIVICDRYNLSTAVYNGRIDGQNYFLNEIYRTNSLKYLSYIPDYVFACIVNPEVAASRLKARGREMMDDRYGDTCSHWEAVFQQVELAHGTDVLRKVDFNGDFETVKNKVVSEFELVLSNFRIKSKTSGYTFCGKTSDLYLE